MASVWDTLMKTAATGRGYTVYKVGEKSTSNGLPIDVQLSIDQEFKKTLLQGVGMFSAGMAIGVFAGIVYSKRRK